MKIQNLKFFRLQKKNQYAFVDNNLKNKFKKRKFFGKLIIPKIKNFEGLKSKIKNPYLNSDINKENIANVIELSKLLNINEKSLIKSLNTFRGLPHRYEIFLRKKNIIFINDSKSNYHFKQLNLRFRTQKTYFGYLVVFQKKMINLLLSQLHKNIVKSYIIGKNINFFRKQFKKKLITLLQKTLKKSLKSY